MIERTREEYIYIYLKAVEKFGMIFTVSPKIMKRGRVWYSFVTAARHGTLIRKPKITSEGKVGALSRILAHRSSDWLGSGGQSRMKREEGEGEKEYCRNTCNYQRRQQLRVGFYSYPSRHRDIIINRCFFLSSPSLLLFFSSRGGGGAGIATL